MCEQARRGKNRGVFLWRCVVPCVVEKTFTVARFFSDKVLNGALFWQTGDGKGCFLNVKNYGVYMHELGTASVHCVCAWLGRYAGQIFPPIGVVFREKCKRKNLTQSCTPLLWHCFMQFGPRIHALSRAVLFHQLRTPSSCPFVRGVCTARVPLKK